MEQNKNQKISGFTLIELMVVISLIALLASLVLIALADARIKARDARRLADMRQMLAGMELYFNEKYAYPTGTASVAAGGVVLGAANSMDAPAAYTPTYMVKIPVAPAPNDGACSASAVRGGNNYWYETNAVGSLYTITFCLGQTTSAQLGPGIHTISPAGLR